jgi:hypothetical protein
MEVIASTFQFMARCASFKLKATLVTQLAGVTLAAEYDDS